MPLYQQPHLINHLHPGGDGDGNGLDHTAGWLNWHWCNGEGGNWRNRGAFIVIVIFHVTDGGSRLDGGGRGNLTVGMGDSEWLSDGDGLGSLGFGRAHGS